MLRASLYILMRFVIIIMFSLLPLVSFSQDGFIKAYDFGHEFGVFFTNMVMSNDTVVISGLVINNSELPQQGVLFARMDTLGNVIDYKFHYDSSGGHYAFGGFHNGFIKVKDNSGYILIAGLLGGGALVIKLNNEGDIVWIKEYFDDNTLTTIPKEVVEVDDGFIIGGRGQSLGYEVQLHLMKIDRDGNKMWERTYGNYNRFDFLSNIIVVNNNEIVVGAEDSKNTSIWQNMDYSTRIFAVDSLGNIKWNWKSANSLDEIWIRGLNKDSNGNWVYASAAAEYEGGGWRKIQPKLIIRDSAFNLIEEKIFDDFDGDDNHFYNLIPVSDGGWLGVGTNTELVPEPIFYAIGHGYAWMNRMNESGDSLWQRNELTFPDTLPFTTKQILHSVVELPSGSFIAAGYYNLWDPNTYGILMKVNKHGCMEEAICTPTIVSTVNATEEKTHMLIYPNPTSQDIIIDYQLSHVPKQLTLSIHNITGKTVHTQSLLAHEGSVRIELNENLPAGTYFCHLIGDGQVIDVERFVLMR